VPSRLEIETPHGPAVAHLHRAEGAVAALALGHGAGGGVEAPDLVAAKDAGVAEGISVALVEQPYRVTGRKAPAPARQLDAAWIAVVERLRANELAGLPLIVGGRSLGARVACRTLEQTIPVAVLCLAFPLQPPARKGKDPSPSRLPELEDVELPMLVVQGENDRFGMPPGSASRTVVKVPGDHGLKRDTEAVGAAVRGWLPTVVGQAAGA
jgi:predicted alpha/beta-hydrolase family hydrolase